MKPPPTLLAITCLLVIIGCESRRPSLPDDLTGVWRTSDPKYAGRFLGLAQDHVTFGTGAGSPSIHAIRKISRARQADGTLYTITYTNDDGQESRLSFVHDPERGGVIWLKNQKDILWKRANR